MNVRVQVANLSEGKHEVSSLALSSSTLRLATGYEDGSIRLWDMELYTCLVTLRYFWLTIVTSANFECTCNRVFCNSGHRSAVTCLTFDPKGMRLASGSKVRKPVKDIALVVKCVC